MTFINTTASDYEIQYAVGVWNKSGSGLNGTEYQKRFFYNGDLKAIKADEMLLKNETVTVVYGRDDEAYNTCNGTLRNLYFAITRRSDTPLSPDPLNDPWDEVINLNFTVFAGAKWLSAVSLGLAAMWALNY